MPAKFEITPIDVSAGNPVQINYTVTNNGDEARAHRHHVEITHPGGGADYYDHFVDVPELEPGATYQVSCGKQSSLNQGDYRVQVTVDVDADHHIYEHGFSI